MSREDLLNKNAEIVKGICLAVKKYAGNAVVLVVTNPLDVMTCWALHITGFSSRKVFGMGITLDASRFSNLISKTLKVPHTDIKATVIGSHGEAMLPLARFTRIKDVALTELTDEKTVHELISHTKTRGQEIVSLLTTGSAFFAPAAAITEIVRCIAKDQKQVLGVSAFLCGEYSVKDICIGVPCRIGKSGIEQVVELELNIEEKEAFVKSADAVRSLIKLLE
jgi:malate dehydrogenase